MNKSYQSMPTTDWRVVPITEMLNTKGSRLLSYLWVKFHWFAGLLSPPSTPKRCHIHYRTFVQINTYHLLCGGC